MCTIMSECVGDGEGVETDELEGKEMEGKKNRCKNRQIEGRRNEKRVFHGQIQDLPTQQGLKR